MKNYYLFACIMLFMVSCIKDDAIQSRPAAKAATLKTTALPRLVTYQTHGVARVTGNSIPGDGYINPTQTAARYNVGGTDLGIMWDMGGGFTGVFFGDTFGSDWSSRIGGGNGSNWRSNVLAFTNNQNLDTGLSFLGMVTDDNHSAKEIIPSPHNTSGSGSFTSIPTAAVRVNNVDYVHYMDVKQWGAPGNWTTNSSSLYMSADNGQTWTPAPGVSFSGTSNFAQAAYAKKDGYVYMIGTRSGRFGDAYLLRFLYKDILEQTEYEYWAGTDGWVKNDELAATPIFNAPVGEISLVYNTHFNRWIVTYLADWPDGIVIRDAENITGEWSKARTVVSAITRPGLYGAFIHPQANNSDDLYFLMSVWDPYNVFLVKAKLRLQ